MAKIKLFALTMIFYLPTAFAQATAPSSVQSEVINLSDTNKDLGVQPKKTDSASQTSSDATVSSTDSSVSSTDDTKVKKSKKIIWFKPEFIDGGEKGFLRTLLSGEAEPYSKIEIAVPIIRAYVKNDVTEVDSEKTVVEPENMRVDANGYFELVLDLPPGSVQLPLRFTKDENSRVYQINIAVSQKKVEMNASGSLKTSPAILNPPYLWGGFGYNYVNLKQDSDVSNVHVGFASFRAPALFFEGFYPLTSNLGLIGSYKRSPGSVKNPPDISLDKSDYSWDIMMVEGRYSQRTWRNLVFDRPMKYSIRFGVNQHSIPFWTRLSLNKAELRSGQVQMFSIGTEFSYNLTPSLIGSGLFRLQLPYASSDLFKVKRQISFDTSIGAYYKLEDKWYVGGFLYSQYHNWKYTHFDPASLESGEGIQILLFTNLEFRAGVTF